MFQYSAPGFSKTLIQLQGIKWHTVVKSSDISGFRAVKPCGPHTGNSVWKSRVCSSELIITFHYAGSVIQNLYAQLPSSIHLSFVSFCLNPTQPTNIKRSYVFRFKLFYIDNHSELEKCSFEIFFPVTIRDTVASPKIGHSWVTLYITVIFREKQSRTSWPWSWRLYNPIPMTKASQPQNISIFSF